MTNTISEPLALVGRVAFDAEGEEIGPVQGVYLDRDDRHPEWAGVRLANGAFTVLPLRGAAIYEDSLEMPFTLGQVEEGPYQVNRLPRELSEEDEAVLYGHYGGQGQSSQRPTAAKKAASAAAATAKDQGQRVASAAADQGREVASTAKDHGQELAATAKERGQEVAGTARQQASTVVQTAKQQATEVASEASEHARSLLEEAKTQLQGQAESQVGRAAETFRRLGAEAQALVDGRPSEASTVGGYVSQAADGLYGLADRLAELREEIAADGLGPVLGDLQSFARRRPGAFLLGATVAGFGVGRLLKKGGGQEPPSAPALPPAATAGPARRPRS